MFLFASRWSFREDDPSGSIEETVAPVNPSLVLTNRNKTEAPPDFKVYLMNWLSVSADNIVILILLSALAIKFIFFEDKSDIAKKLRFKEESEEELRNNINFEIEQNSEMDGKLRQRFASMSLQSLSHSAVFPLSGVGKDWVEVVDDMPVEMVNKEVQTDENSLSSSTESLTIKEEKMRSVEDCLAIYKSEVRHF